MSEDPYSPPEIPLEPTKLAGIECPACASKMKVGTVTGSLDWISPDSTRLERFLGGKKVLGPASFSLMLRNHPTPAFFCEACGVIVVQPKD